MPAGVAAQHVFSKWDVLCTEISHGIRARNAILDGEIVCLDDDGKRSSTLGKRSWPATSSHFEQRQRVRDQRLSPLELLRGVRS
jgi:ATP-dependent DNA ligase